MMIFKNIKELCTKHQNGLKPLPIFNLQIDITHSCNLNCTHCYQNRNWQTENNLNLEEWKRVVYQFVKLVKQLHARPVLIISGGEPLTSPNLFNLVAFVRYNYPDLSIYLLTNGTLINRSNASLMREYRIKAQISIDGPNAQVNDYYRGAGSFDRAVAGAKILREANVNISFQAILQSGVGSFVSGFFEVARLFNATSMDFTRFIPYNDFRNDSTSMYDRMLCHEDLKVTFESILRASIKYQVSTNTDQPLWCLIDGELGKPHSAGFLGLTVNPYGDIQPTSRVACKIGNARRRNGLINAYYDSSIMKRLRKGEIKGCKECQYFNKCRGDRNISYVYHGNYFGPDEQCWHWHKIKKVNQDNQ